MDPFYTVAHGRLLQESLCELEPGTEGFISNTYHRITQLLTRIIKHLRNNVDRYTGGFRKSELRDLLDKKNAAYKRFSQHRLLEIPKTPIAVPKGMVATFPITSEILIKHRGFEKAVLEFSSKLGGVMVALDHPNASRSITDLFHTCQKLPNTLIKPIEDDLQKCFSPNHPIGLSTTTEQFKSRTEVIKTVDNVLLFDEVFVGAVKAQTSIQNTLNVIDAAIDKLAAAEAHMSRDDLIHLSAITTTLGEVFEAYGVYLNICQRVEHSFVHVLNQLMAFDS